MSDYDLDIRISGTSASYDAAASTAARSTTRLAETTTAATAAANELCVAIAKYGAESAEAVTATKALESAQAKQASAAERSALVNKRAAEQFARDEASKATAAEASARRQQESLRKVGTAYGVVGAAAGAALIVAGKAAADFEAKIAQVRSLAKTATSAQVDQLKAASSQYANLGISASQAADAEIELVKAGISVKDQLSGALTGTLDLAAAGQTDVATATEIAAQAMTQFQLSGKDIPHLADLLAAGADKALGSVTDLGEGLKYSGLTAHQLGLSVDDTTAALAEFAQAGLIGSQGGSAFQQMLLRLENPTAKSTALMKQYGLSLYDTQGNFVGIRDLAGQLHDKLGTLTQQQRLSTLATLFGSRAVRAANVLYQDGADGVASWQRKVEDSGFAAEQAAGKMDSLSGDMDKLKAQATNTAIAFGEQLQGPLRGVTQNLTTFVDFLGDIPGPLKEAAVLTLAFTAAVGAGVFVYSRASAALLSMGTTLGLVGKQSAVAATGIEATTAATTGLNSRMLAMRGAAGIAGIGLLTLASSAGKSNKEMGGLATAAGYAALGFSVGGPWGAAIGGGIGLLTQFSNITSSTADALTTTATDVGMLTDALVKQNGALVANGRALVAHKIQQSGIVEGATAFGFSLQELTNAAINPNGEAMKHLTDQMHYYQGAIGTVDHQALAGEINYIIENLTNETGAIGKAREAWTDYVITTTVKVTSSQIEAGNAIRGMGGQMLDTAGDVAAYKTHLDDTRVAEDDLAAATLKTTNRIIAQGNAFLQRLDAAAAYKTAVAAVVKAEHGTADLSPYFGQGQELLNAAASAGLAYANSLKTAAARAAALGRLHDTLYSLFLGMTDNSKAAEHYAEMVTGVLNPAIDKQKKHLDDTTASAKNLGQQKPDVKVTADTTAATENINRFVRDSNTALGHISDEKVLVNVVPSEAQLSKVGHQLGLPGYAFGGAVSGPGGPRDDLIPAWLSNGEFVVNAAAVQAYGLGLMEAINARRLADGGHIGDVSPKVSVGGTAGSVTPVANAASRFADAAADRFGKALNEKAASQYVASGAAAAPGDTHASGPVADIVRGVAAGFGWSSGAEWAALASIINAESGFNPYAQNPTSSAYGLYQFLSGTWAGVGGYKTSDPSLQSIFGDRYIRARYGDPINAWAFHRAHGYYSSGGPVLGSHAAPMRTHFASGGAVRGGDGASYGEMVKELRGLRREIKSLRTGTQDVRAVNAGEIATGVRQTAKSAIQAQSDMTERLAFGG